VSSFYLRKHITYLWLC